jgi:histidinol-phosphate phosphatase family protein
MKKAVFLDRDGVINRRAPEGEYITRWEDMEILPRVPEAIALLARAGFFVLGVSNQRCVAKGLVTVNELESIHERLCRTLAAKGATITRIYYCPHENQARCACRKPDPGMLLTAARDYQIDLRSSWMIGDSDVDIQAGKNAHCGTVRIGGVDATSNPQPDLFAEDLFDAARKLLQFKFPSSVGAP